MAKRPPIGLFIALGALGLAGAAVAKVMSDRRKKNPDVKGKKATPPDAEGIRIIKCPACGADVKEYEFFCSACGKAFDR